MTARRLVLAACILAAAGQLSAQVAATLSVAEGQPGAGPYRSAHLALVNPSGRTIESVLLRPVGGGLAVRHEFTAPPGQESVRTILLPAISADQPYVVTALDSAGGIVGSAPASIAWPAELVARGRMIDRHLEPWLAGQAPWPMRATGRAMLLLGLLVAASAAVLFLRRRALRAGAVAAAAGLAAMGIVYLPAWPEDVDTHNYVLVRLGPGGPAKIDSFTVLAARRTAERVIRRATPPYPAYPDDLGAAGDDAVADPAGGALTMTLRPGAPRIVRPAERISTPPPAPATATCNRADARSLAVEADFPHNRAFVILNDSFWAIRPGWGRLNATLTRTDAKNIEKLLSPPPRSPPGRRAGRLLAYWREKYRRPDVAYLVNVPAPGPRRTRLHVLELSRPGAPSTRSAR